MTRPAASALSLGILLSALVFLQLRSTGEAIPIKRPLTSFPPIVGEWRGQEATRFDLEILNVLKVRDYVLRRYADSAGHSLWLYIAYWDKQRKAEGVHSPRNCLPGSGWEPVAASRRAISVPAPFSPLVVNSYLVQKDQAQQLVFYWYHEQGQAIAGEIAARVMMVKSSILRNRTDGALIRISSPVYGSAPQTSDLLGRYVAAMYSTLNEYLPD